MPSRHLLCKRIAQTVFIRQRTKTYFFQKPLWAYLLIKYRNKKKVKVETQKRKHLRAFLFLAFNDLLLQNIGRILKMYIFIFFSAAKPKTTFNYTSKNKQLLIVFSMTRVKRIYLNNTALYLSWKANDHEKFNLPFFFVYN